MYAVFSQDGRCHWWGFNEQKANEVALRSPDWYVEQIEDEDEFFSEVCNSQNEPSCNSSK